MQSPEIAIFYPPNSL